MRRLTRLLHPELVRWIRELSAILSRGSRLAAVEKSEVAFAANAPRPAQEWKFGIDPVLHVPFSHAYDLAGVFAPIILVGLPVRAGSG